MHINVLKSGSTLPMNDSIPLKNYAFYLNFIFLPFLTHILSFALMTTQILKILLSVIVNITLNHCRLWGNEEGFHSRMEMCVLKLQFIVNILHAHSRKKYPFYSCPLQVKILLIYHLPSCLQPELTYCKEGNPQSKDHNRINKTRDLKGVC